MADNPVSPANQEEAESALSFEAALGRLEEVVRRLEAGDVPLEEALALFEEGVKLARACSERLSAAERKIELLVAREDGTYSLKPFAAEETGTGPQRSGGYG